MSSPAERILILAPFGRDGALLQQGLRRGSIEAGVYADLGRLCDAIPEGAGALLIGDEALGPEAVARLAEIFRQQPSWSDLSLLVMTSGGAETLASKRRLTLLNPLEANTTLLERPLRMPTLLSAARSALRARRRQYQIRDLLELERQQAAALKTANEALRESNESLSEFAYVVSHDLKEPLRSVLAYTQLLGLRYRDRLDAEAEEYMRFVSDGARRMNDLIEDLLAYSSLTKGSSGVPCSADANAALQIVKANLAVLIAENETEITAPHLPVVAVELRQMVQLLQNLITNAIKYRRTDLKPLVAVGVLQKEDWWQFSVRDNGIGFEQAAAEQIFAAFKRLHGNDAGGTGIGLAICKRIVEHHGGSIWVDSTVGSGSTFYFTVPAVADDDGASNRRGPSCDEINLI